MSKKKLKLRIIDIRELFGELNQSHPYQFFLGIGEKSFEFKSNNQSQVFLKKFEVSYNSLFNQFIQQIPKLYHLNISCISYKKKYNSLEFRNSLSYLIERYSDFLNYDEIIENPVREIENLYTEISEQYVKYIQSLSINNRSNHLLNQTYSDFQNTKRFISDFEKLISNKEGFKQVTKNELQKIKKLYFLKIA